MPVVLMHAALFCFSKNLSDNSLLQDYQIGLRCNITGFMSEIENLFAPLLKRRTNDRPQKSKSF